MKFSRLAKLTHLNLRTEGKDDKSLAADMKFETVLESDDLVEFHPNLVSLLWDAEGNPRFSPLIESVKLKADLLHHDVTAATTEVQDARLHKFVISPHPLRSAAVEFTVTFYPYGNQVAQLSHWLQEQLSLTVAPVADLLTGLQEGTPREVTLANGEKVTVTLRPGARAENAGDDTAEKTGRRKRPGGNRRQRVPKDDESQTPSAAKAPPAVGTWPFPTRPD